MIVFPSQIVRTYLWRGLRSWALVRVVVSAIWLLGGSSPLHLGFGARVMTVCLATMLAVSELSHRHEWVFLGNLGVSPALASVWLALPGAAAEVAILVAVYAG